MLEIRNVTKIYRSKTGDEVRALDGVSIQFPEQGMVFLLGKSGSGKSTLLNVIGGLDSYDEGEFIIKGKSSKDFVGSDFDAYRNTFIGFIFQEYNVLDDFSVGANIGLALELQGKKATSQAIESILAKVDLSGYAHRKPNELSGGQKQRVAIARALVKDPQIIMADEPTGALDSNTGKQILDTLKELSKEKLVLVVSHDRDFAEKYGDRIIELADGRVIADVTKHERESERLSAGVHRVNDHILRIEGGYQLTAADLEMINRYLAQNSGDVLLSGDRRVNEELRSAAGISEEGGTTVFEGTVPEKDVVIKEYTKEDSKFIRSRLPMKNAVKIGASSLKHKTVRLIFTIILSLVAFTLFGLADSLASYDKFVAATDSLMQLNETSQNTQPAAFSLFLKRTTYGGDRIRFDYYNSDTFNQEDIAKLEEATGLDFLPVYTGRASGGTSSFDSHLLDSNKESYSAYNRAFTGFVSLKKEDLSKFGLTLVSGMMPLADDQIVITKHIYDQFKFYGYSGGDGGEKVTADNLTMGSLFDGSEDLTSDDFLDTLRNSILLKKIRLRIGQSEKTYTIVGVVETTFPASRYADQLPAVEGDNDNDTVSESNAMMEMLVAQELANTLSYGFHCLGFMTENAIEDLSSGFEKSWRSNGTSLNNMTLEAHRGGSDQTIRYFDSVAGSSHLAFVEGIDWLGDPRTVLGENEIVVSTNFLHNLLSDYGAGISLDAFVQEIKTKTSFGSYLQEDCALYEDVRNAINRYADDYYIQNGVSIAQESLYAELLPLMVEFSRLDLDIANLTTDERYEITNETLQYFSGEKMDTSVYGDFRIRIFALCEFYSRDLQSSAAFTNTMRNFYERWTSFPEDGQSQGWFYRSAYIEYLRSGEDGGYYRNPYGAYSGKDLYSFSAQTLLSLCGVTIGELQNSINFQAKTRYWDDNGQEQTSLHKIFNNWQIVGVHGEEEGLIFSDTLLNEYRNYLIENDYWFEEYAPHRSGIYSVLLAPMPQDKAGIQKLVDVSYEEGGNTAIILQNHVMQTLDIFNGFAESAASIFLWIGLGFALFSALLLMNFIATSISYKKREIGILRAVGARSSDVFKIFFSEATIIALINFALSVAAAIATVFYINNWMASEGMNISLLNFGVRQILLMLGVSILVALLSSFLPVWRIARKKPVDAIKDR